MTKQEIIDKLKEVREYTEKIDSILNEIEGQVYLMKDTYDDGGVMSIKVTDFFLSDKEEVYSEKAVIACRMLNCYTVGELCNKTYPEVASLRGIGKNTMKYIMYKMAKFNLHFRKI